MRLIAALGLFIFLMGLQPNDTIARPKGKSASIVGSWSGGGKVKPHNKHEEVARCRANIRQRSGNRFTGTFDCSSSSGVARQTVSLKKRGAHSYSGSFHNAQHDVSGVINISVHGNSQSASMRSAKGTGWIRMRRR